MSFFQNPFCGEFRGNWVLGDRQHCPTFVVKGNSGRGEDMVIAWARASSYIVSGNDDDGTAKKNLSLTFAVNDFKNWTNIVIDITAGGSTTITPNEIAVNLNANDSFSSWFVAGAEQWENDKEATKLFIRQKFDANRMRFFVRNTGAETVLHFNARAGVGELPTYFVRHTVDDTYRFDFPDGQNQLVLLDPDGKDVDANVISSALDAYGRTMGFDPNTVQEDWQLLGGKSGLFNFQNITVDAHDRIAVIVEYPCGAKVGDFARRTSYTYDNESNKSPSNICETPYTLTSADLISPTWPVPAP